MLYEKNRKPIKSLNLRGKLLTFDQPRLMGIINITEDSFYAQSRVISQNDLITLAGKMLEQGADILDIGACSTRPGSTEIPFEIEKSKILESLKNIRKHFPDAIISVDTSRSEIVRVASGEGADIINDISAGRFDPLLFTAVAQTKLPYILMHSRGTPQDMVHQTIYSDLLTDIIKFIQFKILELNELGIYQIIIDPGFGFAKNIEQNYQLLNQLSEFKLLNKPILVGLSRKSFIYKILKSEPSQALNGTTILNTLALINGANILRVHDVKEAKELVVLYSKIKE